jgi:hypothetical protein
MGQRGFNAPLSYVGTVGCPRFKFVLVFVLFLNLNGLEKKIGFQILSKMD